MGVVYAATDLSLHRPVAIKVIASERADDADFRERFQREARLAASFDHPNVIPVYAAGEEDGHLYIAMRLVDGIDLHRLLRRDGPVPFQRAADIVRQIAEALDAAHAAGLVHRDVKPANVLLADRHVYLGDFGITRAIDADTQVTETDEHAGTVDFMSPEQLRGQRTDARSDVYALGCLLYTALTGVTPFQRPTVAATITAHLEAPAPRISDRSGIPVEFDEVVYRALEKDPERRYPSAGDLGRAAIAAAQGQVTREVGQSVARGDAAPLATTRVIELPPTARIAVKEKPRRHLVAEVIVLGAFFLIALVVGAIAITGGSDDPNRPLSSGDVETTAHRFATAYAHEDARALARLLAPDVRRVSASDVQTGRRAVVGAYASQFRSQVTRAYKLDGLQVAGGPVGRAEARFTVERAGRPPITGNVVLGVERRHGKPRIRLIATESRT